MTVQVSETYIPNIRYDLSRPLHEILQEPEPILSIVLEKWLMVSEGDDSGEVLIKTVDGSPAKFSVRGPEGSTVFNVPPRGRRVSRHRAVRLLQMYGPNGTYTGMDMRTGLTQQQVDSLEPEEVAKITKGHDLHFNENYLIHVVDDVDTDETDID